MTCNHVVTDCVSDRLLFTSFLILCHTPRRARARDELIIKQKEIEQPTFS